MPVFDWAPPYIDLPVLGRGVWVVSTPWALPQPATGADVIGRFRVVHYDWGQLVRPAALAEFESDGP